MWQLNSSHFTWASTHIAMTAQRLEPKPGMGISCRLGKPYPTAWAFNLCHKPNSKCWKPYNSPTAMWLENCVNNTSWSGMAPRVRQQLQWKLWGFSRSLPRGKLWMWGDGEGISVYWKAKVYIWPWPVCIYDILKRGWESHGSTTQSMRC